MATNISLALIITLIGMGLVFLAILLLWGGMALLVRFTMGKETVSDSSTENIPFEMPPNKTDLEKQKAVAVAVAFALNQKSQDRIYVLPLPATAIVSAWQAVMRSNNFSSRRQSR